MRILFWGEVATAPSSLLARRSSYHLISLNFPAHGAAQVCEGRGCCLYRLLCCPFVLSLGLWAPSELHEVVERLLHLLLSLLTRLLSMAMHADVLQGHVLGRL